MTDSIRWIVLPRKDHAGSRVSLSILTIPSSDTIPTDKSHPFYDWPATIRSVFAPNQAMIVWAAKSYPFRWDGRSLIGRAYADGRSMWRDLLETQSGGVQPDVIKALGAIVAAPSWQSLGEHAAARHLRRSTSLNMRPKSLDAAPHFDDLTIGALAALRDNTDKLRAQSIRAIDGSAHLTASAAKSTSSNAKSFNELVGIALRYPILAKEMGLVLEGSVDALDDGCEWIAVKAKVGNIRSDGARTRLAKVDGTWAALRHEDDPATMDTSPAFGRLTRDRLFHLDRSTPASEAGTFADAIDPVGAALGGAHHKALRSEQILVFSSKVAERMRAQYDRSASLTTQAGHATDDVASWPALYADDVVRGICVDICALETGGTIAKTPWFSLCRREATYRVGAGKGELSVPTHAAVDEGYVQPTLLGPHVDGYVSDVALRLDGFSLVCPHPFAPDPTDPVTPPGNPQKLIVALEGLKPPRGTLLPLRWGLDYRLRARPQDMAGNDMFIGGSAHAAMDEGVDVAFRRVAPVAAPIACLAQKSDLDDHEARRESVVQVVVLRDGQSRMRRFLAPVGTFKFAEFAGETAKRDEWLVRSREKAVDDDGIDRTKRYLPDPFARGVVVTVEPASPDIADRHDWPSPVRLDFGGSWPDLEPIDLEVSLRNDQVNYDVLERELDKAEQQPTYHATWDNVAPQAPRISLSGRTVRVAVAFGSMVDIVSRTRLKADFRAHREYQAGWGKDPDAVPVEKLDAIAPKHPLRVVSPAAWPLLRPRIFGALAGKMFAATRRANETQSKTILDAMIHAPTTSKLDVFAKWRERRPSPVNGQHYEERGPIVVSASNVAALSKSDVSVANFPPGTRATRIEIQHDHGDCLHRAVEYRLNAFARVDGVAGVGNAPHMSARGITVQIPSSKPPQQVHVERIVPVFYRRGMPSSEPGVQTFKSYNGYRFYLGKRWWSSGDGEQLAVVLAADAQDLRQLERFTRWANDPIRSGGIPLGTRGVSVLKPDGNPSPSKAVVVEAGLAAVLRLFDVDWDEDAQSWYVDAAVSVSTDSYMPHVRFVLARYQPASVEGMELSELSRTDFIQLGPERTVTVRKNGKGLKIAVDGSHASINDIRCALLHDDKVAMLPLPSMLADPELCADVLRYGHPAVGGGGSFEVEVWSGEPWLVLFERERLPAAPQGADPVPIQAFRARIDL